MNSVTKGLVVAALGLILSGVLVGFALPVHDDYGYDCGTAFNASNSNSDRLSDTFTGGSGESNCSAWRNQALRAPVILILLGATTLAAALVSSASPSRRSTPAAPEPGQP